MSMISAWVLVIVTLPAPQFGYFNTKEACEEARMHIAKSLSSGEPARLEKALLPMKCIPNPPPK